MATGGRALLSLFAAPCVRRLQDDREEGPVGDREESGGTAERRKNPKSRERRDRGRAVLLQRTKFWENWRKPLNSGSAAIGFGTSSGMGKFHDLIDGVNGFTFAAAAANIEDSGNELVLHAVRIREGLKLALPPGDESRDSNGLSTMTADNCAKSFRNYRR